MWKFAQGSQLSLSWHSAGSSSSSSTAAAAVLRAQHQQQQLLQLTSHHHLLLLVLSSGLALTRTEKLYVVYVSTKQHSGTIMLPPHDKDGDSDDAQAPWCYAGPAACAPPPPPPPAAASSGAVKSECGSSFGSSISSPSSSPSSSPAWRNLPPRAVAAVVVAVGLETVVNVVVQLGSAGHTAAAAARAAPSILLQPRCRIQEDSCHSTAAAARPLRRTPRRRRCLQVSHKAHGGKKYA